ncbi:MAG: hypothetical protein QMD85_03380, partial [Candidatus Aenigmarchaeota archaeon]|nr:hypothetical protein [Candidatus Aenigmarchaeota archaeon]MDI6722585.1 hypothetical protein [Candidatus Aenigmarchaeota archaeon]
MDYTNDKERLMKLLKKIDNDFYPLISVQEGDLDTYADMLASRGKIIIDDNALLGYYIEDRLIKVDILWISQSKRKSAILYRLLEYAVSCEKFFDGKVQAKVYERN